MRLSQRLFALSTLLAACRFADGGTIVAIADSLSFASGNGYFISSEQFGTVAWTTTRSYTGVSITVPLYLYSANNGAFHAAAYLTNSIGPGTTVALASRVFTGSNLATQEVVLFSGLTLGPGTYYLTIASSDPVEPNPGLVWVDAFPNSPTYQAVSAPGAVIVLSGIGCDYGACTDILDTAFPPASTFHAYTFGIPFQFSVESVPEPTSAGLLGGGLAALGILSCCFRKRPPGAVS